MDANVRAEMDALERTVDLRAIVGERFRRQLRLAWSLGLIDALLAGPNGQNPQPVSDLPEPALPSAGDIQSSSAP